MANKPPPMTVIKFFGIDKLMGAYRIMKQHGGIWGSILQLYRTDKYKEGTLVGVDKFGNKYFENNIYTYPKNRWVDFSKRVWLDYDASQIPPEWHRWLHHSTDTPPSKVEPVRRDWMLEHQENRSGFAEQYTPYSTTKTKIEMWTPPEKK
uniref:NADH dehydrogenase [ubiquinone] 1 alpha subcomplex subunit 12 n=1 Tax=Romanomermis culicivorax TaxID=13658 RepID=A0A915K096_ROMCU